jgi:hypothetical protein
MNVREFHLSAQYCVLCSTDWCRVCLCAVSVLGSEYTGNSKNACFIVKMLKPVDISEQAYGSPWSHIECGTCADSGSEQGAGGGGLLGCRGTR